MVSSDFSAISQQAEYAGVLGTDVPLLNVVQFLTVVALFVTGFVLVPAAWPRKVAAVTLACTSIFLWAAFGIYRGQGVLPDPTEIWEILLNQVGVALFVALGGWFLARGMHPLGFVVLISLCIPAIVFRLLADSAVPSGAVTLILQVTAVILGIGNLLLARAIDRMLGRRKKTPQSY
jgi:hypothetical protein